MYIFSLIMTSLTISVLLKEPRYIVNEMQRDNDKKMMIGFKEPCNVVLHTKIIYLNIIHQKKFIFPPWRVSVPSDSTNPVVNPRQMQSCLSSQPFQ